MKTREAEAGGLAPEATSRLGPGSGLCHHGQDAVRCLPAGVQGVVGPRWVSLSTRGLPRVLDVASWLILSLPCLIPNPKDKVMEDSSPAAALEACLAQLRASFVPYTPLPGGAYLRMEGSGGGGSGSWVRECRR